MRSLKTSVRGAAYALFITCMAALLLALPAVPARAEELDESRTGSITLVLAVGNSDERTPVVGAQLALWRVGSVSAQNGALSCTPVESFEDFSLIDPSDAALAEGLAAFVGEQGIEPSASAQTGSDGTALVEGLSLGLYLVQQQASGTPETQMSPFLVLLPTYEDGALVYNVQASPKPSYSELVSISVKKTWNDSKASSRPTSVTVALMRGSTQLETVELSAANSWMHRWEGLEKSDAYSVKELSVPSGYTASYSQTTGERTISFTVTNSAGKLPQTGLPMWLVPILVSGGLTLFIVGFLLISRSRPRTSA